MPTRSEGGENLRCKRETGSYGGAARFCYLNVITAQTTLLSNRQTLVNLRTQLMTTSVQLIQALGGGWDTGQLPSAKQVLSQATAGRKPSR